MAIHVVDVTVGLEHISYSPKPIPSPYRLELILRRQLIPSRTNNPAKGYKVSFFRLLQKTLAIKTNPEAPMEPLDWWRWGDLNSRLVSLPTIRLPA
jgi:hypothetical protein